MTGLPTGIDRSGRSGRAVAYRREIATQARERVMFCRKCGAVNPDDSTFCQSCGTRFSRTGVIPPNSTVYDEEQHLRSVLTGRYEVIRQLGAGGMANVYFAREEALDRYVAVKVLPQAYLRNEDFVERFKREAKISAQLEHPNIITIHTIGIEEDIIYFVMNYLPGGSLSDRIKEKQGLEVLEVIRWGRDISKALAYAHERGVIHRDLKPENVMLDDNENAVVTDFGIAFAAEGTRMTRTGVAVGTAAYMSPEQAAGKTIDGRSDLYSCGVLLYQMATGTLPFQATNPAGLMYQHVHEPPEPPDTRNNKIPDWLRDTILTCLEKKPENRFRNATEVLASLTEGYRQLKNDHKYKPDSSAPKDRENLTSELRNLPDNKHEKSPKEFLPLQADNTSHLAEQKIEPPTQQKPERNRKQKKPVFQVMAPESSANETILPDTVSPALPTTMSTAFDVETKMFKPAELPFKLPKWLPVAGIATVVLILILVVLTRQFSGPPVLLDWEWIAEPRFEWAQSFDGQGLARIMINGRYGFIDRQGDMVIEPRFEDVWPFEGDFTAVKENGWWGFINKTGDMLTTTQFDNARGYQNGLVPIKIGSFWGYINAAGTLTIKPQFEDVGMFNEGVAPVFRNGRWGFINRSGVLVTPSRYEDAEPASEGLMAVRLNNRWGYIDTNGDMVIESRFDWAGQFINNRALVSMNGFWGYIDNTGKIIIEPVFEEGMAFSEGYALVLRDGMWAYIDTDGTYLTDEQFEDADSFSEGFALVSHDGAWGYLDTTGALAIAPSFDDARDFSENVAAVSSDGLWGYINTTGAYVIEPQFINAYSFAQGIAAVRSDGGWGFIRFAE